MIRVALLLLLVSCSPLYLEDSEINLLAPGAKAQGTYRLLESWRLPCLRTEGDCKDYSFELLDKMGQGWALGLAWNSTHMVNFYIGRDKVLRLYDPQLCRGTDLEIQKYYIRRAQ